MPSDRGEGRPRVGGRRHREGSRPEEASRVRYRIEEAGFRVEGRVVVAAFAAWFEADGSAWCVGGEGL